jgi:cytochrome oxidase Cu insertion factor (SCO1/SenC/PrrC family)
MSSQMRKVQQQLAGTGVEFVSFTVDPDRDTPEVLAAYARRFQADTATWHFLTGPKETLHHLNRKVFLLGDITPELDHSTRFVLVDRKSRIRGYYTTSQPDETEKLVADARSLLD